MRNSSLLRWTQNNKNSRLTGHKGKDTGGDRNWIHNPETLKSGHVVYLVKFLGCTEVDKPKGIDVVKQGIQKLKFNQQLKKSEGTKTPKVELTISIDGVAIQEPKSKRILYQYPLHRLSYCADDKAEKRFFSFIAKEADTSKHTCFVFVSDKLAEEITLTIGQAFDLAYKKFLGANNAQDGEAKKQMSSLQKRVSLLENENVQLRARLRDVAAIKGEQDVNEYLAKHKLKDICHIVPDVNNGVDAASPANDVIGSSPEASRHHPQQPEDVNKASASEELICLDFDALVDEKLDGFTLDDLNDDDFNPRASNGASGSNGASSGASSGSGSGGAVGSDDNDDDFAQFNPRGVEIPRPAGAPALPPRDAAGSSVNSGGKVASVGASSPFMGISGNPFGGDPFGMSSFNASASQAPLAMNSDMSLNLDDLDPLKK